MISGRLISWGDDDAGGDCRSVFPLVEDALDVNYKFTVPAPLKQVISDVSPDIGRSLITIAIDLRSAVTAYMANLPLRLFSNILSQFAAT